MPRLIDVDVTKIDTIRRYDLGAKYKPSGESDPDEFIYCKYNQGSNAVTATAGHLGYMIAPGTSTPGPFEVTDDKASVTTYVTLTNLPMGFFQSALADGKFGWLQIKGQNKVAMLTDGNVAQNSQIIQDTAANGRVKPAGTGVIVATAIAADAGTVQGIGDALIHIPTL